MIKPNTKQIKSIAKPRVNIDNVTFGELTVIKYNGGGKQLCKCSCGKETEVATGFLIGGYRKSCGCKRYVRKQAENCRHCGVTICDRNEFKSRIYSNGKKGKCSTCKYCKNKASFCLYSYEDPELEKLSVKRNGYVSNQVAWAKNGEIYKQRDKERKRESTANLDDNYIMKKLVSEGWSRDNITQEIIESRRKAVKAYRKKTGLSCKEDYFKYEYKGVKYRKKDYCEIISKEYNLTPITVYSRLKAGWSFDDIVNTPMYCLSETSRKEYVEKMGAQVKIYDLDDNLLYEFNTYGDAAKFLNTPQTNVVNTCTRSGIFQGKYNIRSKISSPEKKALLNKKIKAKNENWCRIIYATPELNELAFKKCHEITYKLYYANNRETIYQKVKDYNNRPFDVKGVKNEEGYSTNKEYKIAKHRDWMNTNKQLLMQYHISYRRNIVDNLNDAYIKGCLMRTIGLKASDITPKMIDIKRKQLIMYRELKHLT